MSDITANIVVQPIGLNVQVQQSEITVSPEVLGLNIYAGGFATAAGNLGTVQFNNGGVLGGLNSVFWTGSKLSLGDTNNITISGGSPNYALRTDGAGNLSWGQVSNATFANIANVAYSVDAANVVGTIANANYSAYAGNVVIATQPNITSLGTLTSLSVNGTANLRSVGNVKITGGTNGQYLQTDGTGNLSFTSGGGSGNGVVGGADTQIQFNNAGNFGGAAGFTFNNTSNLFSVPGNATIVGNVTANIFVGNLNGTANAATVVISNAQPNITSVGVLTGLNVNGNIVAANITANTGRFSGNGSGLSAITGSNVTGTVPSATTAGTVTTNAQPNITSVGTLTSLNVTGNLSAGNVSATGITGTLTTAAQPNITSVGNLTGVLVQGTTQIQQAIEKVTVSAAPATGTVNFDVLNQAIIINTANATANFILNYRGNSTTSLDSIMTNGSSLTATFINTNGSSGFYANAIRIDGSNRTPLWSGNVPNVGTSNGKDVYTFNIIKTASNTYTIFGSQIGFT